MAIGVIRRSDNAATALIYQACQELCKRSPLTWNRRASGYYWLLPTLLIEQVLFAGTR